MKGASLRLLSWLRPYLPRIGVAFALMLLLAATSAGYAFLTGPLLHFLTGGGVDALGPIAGLLPGPRPEELERDRLLLIVPAIIATLGVVKGLSYFGQFYLMGTAVQLAMRDLRQRMHEKLLALSPRDLARAHTGELVSRFHADLVAVEHGLHTSVPAWLRDGVQVLALLSLCFFLDWRLSLFSFGVLPLAAWPLSRLGKKLKRVARQGQKSVGRLGQLVHEAVAGIRVVQAYGMEARMRRRFDEENRHWLHLQKKSLRARGLASPVMELLAICGVAAAIAFAARAVGQGALLSADFLSFLATVALLFQPAKNLGKVTGPFLGAVGAAERIFELLDQRPSLDNGEEKAPPLHEGVRLAGVRLRYGDRVVLDGLDLELRRGEIVALVGASGAGKSTVARLIQRSLDPDEGEVTFDGVEIRRLEMASLRKRIAVVQQEVLLFDDTVRNNVAYGLEVSDEKVREALRAARALDFVEALPQGLDTPVGERGASLSGGQRQRLAIARALLRDAPLLILDEATSALDVQSEAEVQAALQELMQGRTCLVIAHRLATIRLADRICVLEDGRIVEQGLHDELLAAGGRYARLFEAQDASGSFVAA